MMKTYYRLVTVKHDKEKCGSDLTDILIEWILFFLCLYLSVPLAFIFFFEGIRAWWGGYFREYLTLCRLWLTKGEMVDEVQQHLDTLFIADIPIEKSSNL